MPYVRSGDRSRSLERLRDRAARAASLFAGDGVAEDGAIALLLRNDIAFLEVLLAAGRIGAHSVPMNWHFKPAEVRHILVDSQASHLVVHADLLADVAAVVPPHVRVFAVGTPPEICAAYGIADEVAGAPPGVDDWDAAVEASAPAVAPPAPPRGSMFYTSGTTGTPKGVKRQPVAAAQRRAIAELRAQWFGHRRGMRTAMIGPMYHSVQTSYATAAVATEGTVLLLPRFDAEETLRLIEREQLTHLHLVPTMMQRLVQLDPAVRRRYDLGSLEFVIHGAAPCPPAIKRELIAWWGPIVHEYYGTTEAGLVCRSSSDEWLARPGTVGRPWPGRVVRVLDDEGVEVAPGVTGNVYMSLGAMPDFTYHNAGAKRAGIERDGLITCGDIGYVDSDGYLFLCDRKDDTVISGGVNVYPAEVEAVLLTHPAVVDCVAFGVPHADLGEQLAAAIQLRPGAAPSDDELRRFLGERLAKFKLPRRFEFHDSLPRDASGKVFRRLLRAPHWPVSS